MIDECTFPHRTECSAVFDPKQHNPWAAILPQVTFLFPQMNTVLEGKRFADGEAVKQKKAEALVEGNQNQQIQKQFWAVEKPFW